MARRARPRAAAPGLAFAVADLWSEWPVQDAAFDLVLIRACECFAHFCSMKGLQQVVVVLLRDGGDWSEGEPVGVGR
jgi:hypothetical protein